MFYFFLEREWKGRRKRGRETLMYDCLLRTSYWGPGPQPWHVTGNRTGNPFVHRPTLNPLTHAQSTELHQPGLYQELWGSIVQQSPPSHHRLSQMRISLPRHDLLGGERWLISQRRRAKSFFLHGLLLGSICTEIQVKLINHCQAVRIKQQITYKEL